ncbi:unnamed protein product [Rhizoctonia solani]|uniref:Retrotransposon gag domain-containing protein n=1 Tax=Rhizoctonia solani TaxID=456999 RepID=A0A8H3BKZ9_9AGAM|nr:unnamed protein product [Rhizoctonia solani]
MSGQYHAIDANTISLPAQGQVNDNTVLQALVDIKTVLASMNNDLALAITQIGSHDGDLSTLDANIQKQEQSINNLNTALVHLVGTIQTPGSGSSSGITSGSKAPKLATPDKFDGTNKNKATSFRVAVTHYLQVSYPSLTVDKQIAFIISCLDGKAHEWLEPYLEEDVVSGACNRTENFWAKLRNLKQTKSIQEYFKDFQTYSQGLGYNNISLWDMFYDGLSIKIKEFLMAQDFDHSDSSVLLQALANKALKIDQCLEQFQAQNKGSTLGSSSKKDTQPLSAAQGAPRGKLSVGEKVYQSAAQGAPRGKLSVGEKVYQLQLDGKAKKGTIQAIEKNAKGFSVPTVKWNNGTTGTTSFKTLKKDEHPAAPAAFPPKPQSSSKPSSSGPAPMDLDSAQSKAEPIQVKQHISLKERSWKTRTAKRQEQQLSGKKQII